MSVTAIAGWLPVSVTGARWPKLRSTIMEHSRRRRGVRPSAVRGQTSPTRRSAFRLACPTHLILGGQPARTRLAELLHRRCRDRVRSIRRRLSLHERLGPRRHRHRDHGQQRGGVGNPDPARLARGLDPLQARGRGGLPRLHRGRIDANRKQRRPATAELRRLGGKAQYVSVSSPLLAAVSCAAAFSCSRSLVAGKSS
jgi:hypothetical protein